MYIVQTRTTPATLIFGNKNAITEIEKKLFYTLQYLLSLSFNSRKCRALITVHTIKRLMPPLPTINFPH